MAPSDTYCNDMTIMCKQTMYLMKPYYILDSHYISSTRPILIIFNSVLNFRCLLIIGCVETATEFFEITKIYPMRNE